MRDTKPERLFRHFKETGGRIENPFAGIYYIYGRETLFAAQIIVTGELNKKNHVWLTALSDQLEKKDVERLLKSVSMIQANFDKELADSVLEVSIKANLLTVEELKGDDTMCQALMEVMGTEIAKIRGDEKRLGKILGFVEAFRELGKSDNEIITLLMQKYDLKEEALSYL